MPLVDFSRFQVTDSPEHEAWHKHEHDYVMFVKAIMLEKKMRVRLAA
jgi:hypothetical protein